MVTGVSASVPDSLFDTLTAIHTTIGDIAVQTTVDSILDSLGNLSISASVPDSLFDTLTAIHGDIGAGTGGNPLYVYVLNYADSSAISNAKVTCDSKFDGTGSEYKQTTNGTGLATFSMTTNDSLLVSATAAPPYTLVSADSIVITSDPQYDTIYMQGPTISAASSPTMVTVWGQIVENGKAVRRAKVEVTLNGPDSLTIDSTFVSYSRSDVTDTLGVWELPVYVNGQMNDTSSYYEVKEYYGDGLKRTYWFRCGPEDTATTNVTNASILLITEP